jgi:hypothetical protein
MPLKRAAFVLEKLLLFSALAITVVAGFRNQR